MILVETDVLLALVSKGDKHHGEAVRLLDMFEGETLLSPYALVELNLLIRSGEVAVREVGAFYTALGNLLEYRAVDLLPSKPLYHAKAYELRRRYKQLTYFDSLHAAASIVEEAGLVSYDRTYTNIANLKYNHPAKYV
ncbi:PIN domain-containing protein [Candidatus Hecatella orcuttiae]|uniref:type II toxin-antitoxin system VapC family toxin n=1 Tax=Candidatus Hecatella orcuttiae TaxID=1935119 RepID=UPI002867DDCF|nr:PIN domain-containing protein [Candidatus Hecatella orcuttiae]